MPFFGLVWVTSWVSCFLASSQSLLKVPDYLTSAFPARVFSVVSSPIEIPTPLVFPTPLSSGVWSSNSSIAAIPNLAFQIGAAPFLLRSQPVQAAVRSPSAINAVENTFCRPESEPKEDAFSVATAASSPSPSGKETSHRAHRNVSKASFSDQVLQVIQSLLPWRQRVESAEKVSAESIVVVSTRTSDKVGDKQNTERPRAKRGFWEYSQLLAGRAVAAVPSDKPEQFQIWVKDRLIGQLSNQQQADLIAQRLKQFVSNPSEPDLNTSPVEPALVDGLPAIKVADRLLLKIDDALATDLEGNRDLLAIKWANNLRIALGNIPLPLPEAQRRMHNLVETERTIEGLASWYGPYFHGRITATGEVYNQQELTAAHPSLPFNTYLKVRNLENGNSVIVRINDRGPYIPGRSLDLSREAARCINSEKVGVVPFEAVIMQQSSAQSEWKVGGWN